MHLEIEILTTCTFYTRISVIVLRGRPFPFYYPLERGKERGLVEACTSFRVIPLDSWGAILSLYCLFRGVAFCDVELNTRIKTAFSSLRILFWWRWTIQLLCVLLRWNMDAYLVANRLESRCLYFFTYWLWQVTVLLFTAASSHIIVIS